ncbi:hypothetical protein GE21DRAFT_1213509, partial [Neurospora crassa]
IYINNIIITFNSIEKHLKYLNTIFSLFISKNIILLPKKSYLKYPNIKLLGFYINNFKLSTTKEHITAFQNLTFPNILKVLK